MGQHQFRLAVFREIVDTHHHISPGFQKPAVHKNARGGHAGLKMLSVRIELQRAAAPVEVAVQAKDKGAGGVIGIITGLGTGHEGGEKEEK